MRITKEDKNFYVFEQIALKTIIGMSKSDDYLGIENSKNLMQRVSDSFGMTCPEFKTTRKDSTFCYYRCHAIYYNLLWGLNTPIVLHEMCHALHGFFKTGGENHGPEYTRVWIDVFSRMYDIDPGRFEELADRRNIKYTTRKTEIKTYTPKY